MGNSGFYACLSEPQGVSARWKEAAQTQVFILSRSLLLNHLEPQSSKQTLTTYNANRYCRLRFSTFVGQPLTKQLYYYTATRCSCKTSWTTEIISVVHVVLSAQNSLCVNLSPRYDELQCKKLS